MRKQPANAVPLGLDHVARGFRGVFMPGETGSFERAFARYTGTRHAIAVGNGTTAMYVILAALMEIRERRNEVVLPAYTLPSLIPAFNRLGLRTVLCDVGRATFNMDPSSLEKVVGRRTLAVIPVHMFGLPCVMEQVQAIAAGHRCSVIEDACQAPGANLDGVRIGAIGDAAVFSFSAGTNISTFQGGMVTTDNDLLMEMIREKVAELPRRSFACRCAAPAVLAAFSLAMRPRWYGTFHRWTAAFRSSGMRDPFYPSVYPGFMAGTANGILGLLDEWNAVRRAHAERIRGALSGDTGLLLPAVIPGAEPVYSHLPVVFHDVERLVQTRERLFGRGIDTDRMYGRPIHHVHEWLGYQSDPEPFPGAAYIAPRLLCLPTHPYLEGADIDTMTACVRETA